MDSNPGLRSRFPRSIDFASYSSEELLQIARSMAKALDNDLSEDGADELVRRLSGEERRGGFERKEWGNARSVRNVIEAAIAHRDVRISASGAQDLDSLIMLTAEDVASACDDFAIGGAAAKDETVDDVLAELDAQVGQAALKEQVRALLAQAHLAKERKQAGLLVGDLPLEHLLFVGPPGTGKTTIASLISRHTDRRFVEVSAVSAGVKEVRDVIAGARRALSNTGQETVLFVDEVHRFSKAQQDALLPGVENRWVSLVAATTENPHFSVISPLLSRSLLLTLQSLTDDDIATMVRRAIDDERGLAGAVSISDDALDHLVRLAGGDGRRALTYLEAAAGATTAQDRSEITVEDAAVAVDRAAVRYDRQGDQHYDVTSAFIKSIRGSDVDAALHYLARMVEAGEDPRFIARRLMIHASEDIGMADPTALPVATATAQAVAMIGFPEARIPLAQAVIHLATAPKSNAVVRAIDAAMSDVRAGKVGTVPPALRDAHYSGAKKLGHGHDYVYAHDDPRGVVGQQYAPDDVDGAEYYSPTSHGAEGPLSERLQRIRAILRQR